MRLHSRRSSEAPETPNDAFNRSHGPRGGLKSISFAAARLTRGGKGYATSALQLAVGRLQAMGVTRVPVTVNPANVASIRAVLANGGAADGQGRYPDTGSCFGRGAGGLDFELEGREWRVNEGDRGLGKGWPDPRQGAERIDNPSLEVGEADALLLVEPAALIALDRQQRDIVRPG